MGSGKNILQRLVNDEAKTSSGAYEFEKYVEKLCWDGLFEGYSDFVRERVHKDCTNLQENLRLDLKMYHQDSNYHHPICLAEIKFKQKLEKRDVDKMAAYAYDDSPHTFFILICNQDIVIGDTNKNRLSELGIGIFRLPINKERKTSVLPWKQDEFTFRKLLLSELKNEYNISEFWELYPKLILRPENVTYRSNQIINRNVENYKDKAYRAFKIFQDDIQILKINKFKRYIEKYYSHLFEERKGVRDPQPTNFCNNCDSILKPHSIENGKVIGYCQDCEGFGIVNFKTTTSIIDKKLLEDPERGKLLVLNDTKNRIIGRPSKEMYCNICTKIQEIEYWELQTRSIEKSPTRFYRCLNCEKIWREND